jgi:hypothetical protein
MPEPSRRRPPPVKVVRDPQGRGWRLKEPDGTLLRKVYTNKQDAIDAMIARNMAWGRKRGRAWAR